MKSITLIFLLVFSFEKSFCQHIEEIFVGRSLDKTIEQGKYKGHELIEVNENVATFCVVSQFGKAWLSLHASPKTNIVWYGTSWYSASNKQQLKDEFQKMNISFNKKYGIPYKIKRKEVKWVFDDCIIKIRRLRKFNVCSVISRVAYRKIASEL